MNIKKSLSELLLRLVYKYNIMLNNSINMNNINTIIFLILIQYHSRNSKS